MTSYSLGFQDVPESERHDLSWQGEVPSWLKGTLFRNGPGRFDRGKVKVNHWFDGLALLHSLALSPESVAYHSRFVRSHDYRVAEDEGLIGAPAFASDPCRSLFRKLTSLFVPDATDNPNISIVRQGDRFLALTELPIPMVFDPKTLRSVAPHVYRDSLPAGSTTAHPHQEGELLYNQILHYSARSSYRLYWQEGLNERREYARIPVSEVSYVHSFGLSENFTVLCCCPLQVAPWKLLVRDKPFIENFEWKPQAQTRFHIVSKPGKPKFQLTLKTEPFFCFHHVNSFEADGLLWVDLVAYDNADVISELKLARLEQGKRISFGQLRRYRIDLQEGTITRAATSKHTLELNRINYSRCNGKDYRYVYGVSADTARSDFYDRLIKVDVKTDQAMVWEEADTFPGEPVFVARPGGAEEDDGVILSVVLCAKQERSFLLLLKASDFSELARCYLPKVVPHGFHGHFEEGSCDERLS